MILCACGMHKYRFVAAATRHVHLLFWLKEYLNSVANELRKIHKIPSPNAASSFLYLFVYKIK